MENKANTKITKAEYDKALQVASDYKSQNYKPLQVPIHDLDISIGLYGSLKSFGKGYNGDVTLSQMIQDGLTAYAFKKTMGVGKSRLSELIELFEKAGEDLPAR